MKKPQPRCSTALLASPPHLLSQTHAHAWMPDTFMTNQQDGKCDGYAGVMCVCARANACFAP